MKQFLSLINRWPSSSTLTRSDMDLDRDFVIPDDERVVLRILDKLATQYTKKLDIVSDPESQDLLHETIRIGIAKIDYAHIEKGHDLGEIISELFHGSYERCRDLSKCGHSWTLIHYYLNTYSIFIPGVPEPERKDSARQRADYKETKQYKDARANNLCDENGKLRVSNAKYTRFAVLKYGTNTSQDSWREYDMIFLNKRGVVISFVSFMQSHRDQGDDGIKEKGEKEFPHLCTTDRNKKIK